MDILIAVKRFQMMITTYRVCIYHYFSFMTQKLFRLLLEYIYYFIILCNDTFDIYRYYANTYISASILMTVILTLRFVELYTDDYRLRLAIKQNILSLYLEHKNAY